MRKLNQKKIKHIVKDGDKREMGFWKNGVSQILQNHIKYAFSIFVLTSNIF
jgi:hypothetical protein